MSKRYYQGFSIIELLVVIAILGILSSLALAAYNQYITKAKVAEGIALLRSYAKQYEESYNINGVFPIPTNQASVIATPNTTNVNTITAGNQSSTGQSMYIFVTFQDSLGFGTNNRVILVLIGNASTKQIRSYCGQWQSASYVSTQYLPNTCNLTNINTFPGAID